jgi:fatty acid desaturase
MSDMDSSLKLDPATPTTAETPPAKKRQFVDDQELIRAAAQLTRELSKASPATYWFDFLASAGIGYGALLLCIMTQSLAFGLVAGLVSVLALYRAGSFIHEVTHLKADAVPGFRTGWNLVIGVPLLICSYMYEGIHTLHHTRVRYGTADDPEYLPLALMRPWTIPVFVIVAAFAPLALFVRSAILSPLSAILPPLRKLLVERYSALSINPAFRRPWPTGEFRKSWLIWESVCSVWAIGLLSAVWTGLVPLRAFLILLVVMSGSIVINQVRTLVAHLWQNEGEPMSVTDQYLDSVNVPPPAMLPAIWAPVGLRYHAIHHLLPSLPYHALGEAHRRLVKLLPTDNPVHRGNYGGLFGLVSRLMKASMAGAGR